MEQSKHQSLEAWIPQYMPITCSYKPSEVRQAHRNLVSSYQRHGSAVEGFWQKSDYPKRIKIMSSVARGGPVPQKGVLPEALTYLFTPEWNEQDIANLKSNLLLIMLKHRSTTTLCQQFLRGPRDSPGDRSFVQGLPLHKDSNTGFFIFLQDGAKYGDKYRSADVLNLVTDSATLPLCVNEAVGELVFLRQMSVMKILHLFISAALDDLIISSVPSVPGRLDQEPIEHHKLVREDPDCSHEQPTQATHSPDKHHSIGQPTDTAHLSGEKGDSEQLTEGTSQTHNRRSALDADQPKTDDANQGDKKPAPSAAPTKTSDHTNSLRVQHTPSKEPLPDPPMPLVISKMPSAPTLADFLVGAIRQEYNAGNYRQRLKTDGRLLCGEVLNWWLTIPEGLPDQNGRILISYAERTMNRHLSLCLFETMHAIDRDIAAWNCIRALLYIIVETGKGKKVAKKRARLLQELTNVCHRYYSDIQSLFRRNIQSGLAQKYHGRVAESYDEFGAPVVVLKNHPGDFARSNPLLHYILRLCQPDTGLVQAADWARKIHEFYQEHPERIAEMKEGDSTALIGLAIFSEYFRDLSRFLQLPPVSHDKGQEFIGKANAVHVHLDRIKPGFSAPEYTKYLCQMAKNPSLIRGADPDPDRKAVEALDEFVKIHAGFATPELYRNAIRDSYGEAADVALSDIKIDTANIDSPFRAAAPENVSDAAGHGTDRTAKKKRKRNKKKKNKLSSSASATSPEELESEGENEPSDPLLDEVCNQLISDFHEHQSTDCPEERSITSFADEALNLFSDEYGSQHQSVDVQQSPAPKKPSSSQADNETQLMENDEEFDDDERELDEERYKDRNYYDFIEHAHDADDDAEVHGPAPPADDPGPDGPEAPKPVFKVSAKTAGIFAMIFDKSLHRGSVTWTSFKAAFAEIGFSVAKKKGSAIAFIPPAGSPWNQIQFHEAHGGVTRVEGYRSQKMAYRLKKAYGWDEKTFEVA